MALTKKLQAEIRNVYDTYWNSYLTGNLKTFASCLDEAYWLLGTTREEVFTSKKATIKWYKNTIDQILGKIELRKRKITMKEVGTSVVVQETCDIYAFADAEWTFYAPLRLTTTLLKKNNRWKVVQQHGSLPDTKVDAGETLGLDKVKAENVALREAVKRRTVELESKNRELEIEASLERVRTVAMGMNKPEDMLNVCRIISDQLQQLGVQHIRNVQTAIINEYMGQYTCYQYFTAYDKEVVEQTDYLKSPVEHEMVKQMLSSRNAHMTRKMSGKKLNDFREHRKRENYLTDPLLDNTDEIGYCFLSIGEGGLGLSLYQPLNELDLTLFNKFHQVFALAYQRFRDIEKAEAQAREAQIEAALERVRSRSMAMHKSDELLEAGEILFSEMQKLGIESLTAGFVLMDKEEKNGLNYTPDPSTKKIMSLPVIIPHNETIHMQRVVENWKKGTSHYVVEMDEKETIKHQTFIAERSTNFTLNAEQLITISPARLFLHNFYFKEGYLLIVGGTRLSAEQIDIMLRFTKVFQQTYTRFLDLQKAEAQAREAEIELALERVRARTMAMQSSNELQETAAVLFNEFKKLGIENIYQVTIGIYNEEERLIDFRSTSWADDGAQENRSFSLSMEEPTVMKPAVSAWKANKKSLVIDLSGEMLEGWLNYRNKVSGITKMSGDTGGRRVITAAYYSKGHLSISTPVPVSADTLRTLERFAAVFDQTYTRFLDLQKAEAQAREAQIEAALERIRAKALAMQTSNDLLGVANVLREQMGKLGQPDLESSIVHLYNDDAETFEAWYAYRPPNSTSNETITDVAHDPKNSSTWAREVIANYKSNKTEYTIVASGEKIQEWYKVLEAVAPAVVEYDEQGQLVVPDILYYHFSKFSGGALLMISNQEPAAEAQELQRRAALVFDLAYTRFLDLQKAEAQAREAQIEAALERVRAKTMAMHKSEQLPETAQVLFEQFAELGKIPDRISIGIIKEELQVIEWWVTDQMGSQLTTHFNSSILQPTIAQFFTAWKEGKDSIMVDLSGEALKEWIAFVRDEVKMPIDESKMKGRRVHHGAFFSQGLLLISAHEPMPHETLQLLVRFAKVFSQTYTRFLDLQKSEAQAREAQIETALERVRSRSMAMHGSEELGEVIQLVFEQLCQLNFTIDSAQFDFDYKKSNDVNIWIAVPGQEYSTMLHVPYIDNSVFNSTKDALMNGLDSYSIQYTQEEKVEFFQHFFKQIKFVSEERKELLLKSEGFARSVVLMNSFWLGIQNYSGIPYSEHELLILKRFGKVFEQTYTRFLDLQKAEAQAREALIETALERVRGKAMAMHNSKDLLATAGEVFTALRKLGIKPIRCGVGLLNGDARTASLYHSITTEKGDEFLFVGTAPLEGHPVIVEIYDCASRGEPCFPVLKGELLRTYYEKVLANAEIPNLQPGYTEYGYFLSFHEGFFYGWSGRPISEQEIKILNRFKAIVDLTFRRYIELQKVEANALEAIRSASLDRVRAETASMRTTGDLEKITPLIWNELTILGVPFFRCGVYIVDEVHEQIHTFLSTPDGKAIGAFHLPFNATQGLSAVLLHWRRKELYRDHWDEEAFIDWTKSLVEHGAITASEKYVTENHPTDLYLHFLPFLQGMLYVGNTAPLSDEQLQLVQKLADAFSTAYARYEDFNKLEAAKKQVDSTLNELQATQKQLIQSEKMASLGELTAGIAHEIQNPLNFVNNFSEVSNELIKEIQDIRHKTQDPGSITEEDEILNDIASNLEKINHHGKRAADIVKGMLQHSRSSSGVKEPTDINALADEYLRLAYHGLRAKDKSFNATMNTDFDETLGTINVVPQDIGRVILNLITNAFYAVNERYKAESGKPKAEGASYEPTVSVSTKKVGGKVLVSVKDNGNGIPDKIKEKIFQPFFTTKPAGQGTGLGLSLSYDIVKAHGGEVKVESYLNEGSKFTIIIPDTSQK